MLGVHGKGIRCSRMEVHQVNAQLLAAAEFHTTALNNLQTGILYDLCWQADEAGECKPNIEAMAFRWRVHEKTVRWMLSELEVAGFIQKGGAKVSIMASILECREGCLCPLAAKNAKVLEPKKPAAEKAEKPKPEKKAFSLLSPPDPGSMLGIYEKLKSHWRGRWHTAPTPGHIERALGPTIREILSQPVGSVATINNFERAFINYLQAAKDSESGKISLKNFCSSWGVWVNPGHKNTVHDDATSMLKDAIGMDL